MTTKLNPVAVTGIVVAPIVIYAGLTGRSVRQAIQFIITGKSPAKAPKDSALSITGTSGSASGGGVAGTFTSDSAIASDAMKYEGHPYLYGGSPGPSGTSPWDCSSFVNWVLGHDLGLTLPGGVTGYDGTSHGPTTLGYLAWGGAVTINRASLAPGDLCVWQTHIGIYIGNGEMISALNESLGTQVTTVTGGAPGGELLVCRRVKG